MRVASRMGPPRVWTAGGLALVAVCGVVLVTMNLEVETGAAIVRQELVAPESSLVAKATGSAKVAAKDHSQQKMADQLTNSARREHKGNKAARHEMRGVAAAHTQALLKTEFASLERRARQKVNKAAKAAAAHEARKHTADSAPSVSPERKLALLRRDDEVLGAAVKKARAGAAEAAKLARSEATHFQDVVKGKLKKAKGRLAILLKQLAAYKGTKKTQKKARADLQQLQQQVAHVTEHLAAKKSQLHRIVRRQHQHVKETRKKVKKSRKKLKKLLQHYQGSLKHLKTKLGKVNQATDINEAIGTRINAAHDVLAKQKKKIRQLKTDVKRMTAKLRQTKLKTKAFTAKAKKQKHQLHAAHARYKQLSQKIADLDKKAKQGAAEVVVQVHRGNSASQAGKAVQKLKQAVSKASGGKKAKAALLKRMIHAASSAAVKEATKFKPPDSIRVPGINRALSEVADMTTGLDLLGTKERVDRQANVEMAEHTASEADEFAELNRNAMSARQVHQAELLAHVAHTLYQRAMTTGKASDKTAARAAMKRAIAAHDALSI